MIDTQVGIARNCVDAEATIARMARLVERARAASAPVVWVQDEDGLARGSDEWQLAAPLQPIAGETRIYKRYWDAFVDTGLSERLAELGVTRLVVAGAHTDYCIRTTSLRAASEGFDVTLVSDAHMTGDAEGMTAAAIVAHTNLYFDGLPYPGRSIGTAAHDEVAL